VFVKFIIHASRRKFRINGTLEKCENNLTADIYSTAQNYNIH